MTRKLAMIAVFAALYAGAVMPANAISAKYRAQLERNHTTQVQEIHRGDHLTPAPSRSVTLRQAGLDADATVGADIGHAADFLISQGWRANQGDWHKGKFIIRLVVENGFVVNAQVM